MTETFMWLGIAYAIITAFVALLDAKEAHKECGNYILDKPNHKP